jgi:diguanylate cyclase (GGDEF)-like protein
MKITLGARILFACFLTLVVGMLYFFGIVRGQSRLSALLTGSLSDSLAVMRSAETIKHGFVMHDDLLFRYISVGNPAYLDESLAWRAKIRAALDDKTHIPASDVVDELLSELESQSRQYFSDADLLIATYEKSNEIREPSGWFISAEKARAKERKAEAREAIQLLSAAGQNRLTRIYSLCEKLVDISRERMSATQKDMTRLLTASVVRARSYGLTAGTAVFLIALWLAAGVSGPLRRLLEGVKHVMGGNLSVEIPVQGLDEISELTHSFNTMTRNLQVARDRLVLESVTDPLTGIFNLRHFQKVLAQETSRALRYGGSVSLLIADLDHFKKLNDAQGHEVGNVVLKQLVEIFKSNVRESDCLARYGGEEFAILLVNTGKNEARETARKLVQAVADALFPGMDTQPGGRITVSIGGATFPEDTATHQDLIVKADKALYQAKAEGRNRAVWYVHA